LAWTSYLRICFSSFDPIRGGVGGEQVELESPEASARWREGFRRHEAIRGLLERHAGLRRAADIKDVAWDLRVSQATLYRLITTYKTVGTVEALMPRTSGRPAGLRLLDKKVEALIAKCIGEIYLRPNRPRLKRLTDEVDAKCAAVGFSLPDRRTIRARVRAIPERTRALRRSRFGGSSSAKRRCECRATAGPFECHSCRKRVANCGPTASTCSAP